MNITKAAVSIVGVTPYSQSRKLLDERPKSKSWDEWEKDTWLDKLNVENGKIIIPGHGIQQAIIAAAKYSGAQIPGQGKKTWTAKFTSGILIDGDGETGATPADARAVSIQANSDGVRGSGKRVLRIFPQLDTWSATFDVLILDPIISRQVFQDTLEIAGQLIGLGRFRPEKGGRNGRFIIDRIDWQTNVSLAA